jgi:ACS family hexuronate transporter-like MFS transporter
MRYLGRNDQLEKKFQGVVCYHWTGITPAISQSSIDACLESVKVAWLKLLSDKQTWAFVIGKFMTYGIWWFFLFWLHKYLENQFNMKGANIVFLLAILHSMTRVGSKGWKVLEPVGLPMYFINNGHNPYNGRMKAMLVIALFPLLVFLAQPFAHFSFWMARLLIGVEASAHQAW